MEGTHRQGPHGRWACWVKRLSFQNAAIYVTILDYIKQAATGPRVIIKQDPSPRRRPVDRFSESPFAVGFVA